MAAQDQGTELALACLIDTGPVVAFCGRRDPAHASVSSYVEGFSGQLLTTDAVVVEVMYFLSEAVAGPSSFAELLVASGAHVIESTQPEQVRQAVELMNKYADTPMDFADATLVLAANTTGILDILTLDRRGFSTYRASKGRRFRLALDQDPS